MKTDQQLIDEGYVEGKKSFEFLSKEFGENFKWERLHKAMIAMEWYWYFGKDESGKDIIGIPSLETIKNAAYRLLKNAYESGSQHCHCGFSAGWDGNELFLTFTIEQWSESGQSYGY